MYRIMIVEDSKLIIRDLKRILQSSEYDLEIAEAYNGQEALEKLDDLKPDIIFSDIKMQIMNGLEFIRKAKELYPQLKCVIISGFSDFEFTHEALRLQVDDYIVKPVDESQLLKVFQSLTKEIDSKKKQREEIMIANAIQCSSDSKVSFLPDRYTITVIMAGLMQEYSSQIPRKEISEHLMNVCSSQSFWIANSRHNNEKVIIWDMNAFSEEEVSVINTDLLKDLAERFSRVNLISSGIIENCESIVNQYEILHYQLKRSILFEANGIYHCTDNNKFQQNYIQQKEQLSSFQKKLYQLTSGKRKDDFDRVIRNEIARWRSESLTVAVLKKYIVIILDELFVLACGTDSPVEDPGAMSDRFLSTISSFDLLETALFDYSDNVWEAQNERIVVSSEQIRSIVAYMKEHLYDNLSLQEISGYLDLSTSYICRIFKIYYNDTPISFYNQLKIQEARRLIEEYPEMKIKDVADMLGFNDQYYFSKVFKQEFGVSPSIFRGQISELPE